MCVCCVVVGSVIIGVRVRWTVYYLYSGVGRTGQIHNLVSNVHTACVLLLHVVLYDLLLLLLYVLRVLFSNAIQFVTLLLQLVLCILVCVRVVVVVVVVFCVIVVVAVVFVMFLLYAIDDICNKEVLRQALHTSYIKKRLCTRCVYSEDEL